MAIAQWKIAADGNWTDSSKWVGGTPPANGDDAVLSVSGFYTVNLTSPISVASIAIVDAGAFLQIQDPGGTELVTGALTNAGTIGVDAGGPGGSTLSVGGMLANTHAVQIGNGGMTAASLLSVGNVTNAGGSIGITGGQNGASASLLVTGTAPTVLTGSYSITGNPGGASLDFGAGTVAQIGDGAATSGYLLLDGTGAFAEVGATNSNSALTGLATIAGDGVLDLRDAVTVTTAGALSVNGGNGRLKIDAYGGAGGGNVTIGGALTNSSFGNFSDGGVSLGNGSMTAADLLTVDGTFTNTGGLLNLTGGQAGAAARMVVAGALGSVLTGNYSIIGDAGGASLQYGAGGIAQIGDDAGNGGYLFIDGANAFAEVGATNSNSALTNLATIAGNGVLDLRDAVTVSTAGALSVNGGNGRLKIDAYGGAGGGNVTIGGNLSNSSFGNFNDGGISVGNTSMTAADLLTVDGTFTNTGGLLVLTGGRVAGAAAAMVVTGAAQNTLTGNYSIVGDTGGATLQYGGGGITQNGDGASNGGYLYIDGANAFIEIGATNSNSALNGLTTIAGNGVLDLRDAVNVATAGALTVNGGNGRLKIDAYGGSGGGNVSIGGNLRNSSFGNFSDGGVSVGSGGMTAADLLTVNGTFDNTGGLLVLTGGQAGAAARMVVTGAAQATLTGNYSIAGDAGGASLRYGGGGITQIGDGASNAAVLTIDGANAFFEIGATDSNSALTGLTTIAGNGLLDLRDSVSVTTTGALTINGGDGRLKIDAYGGSGGGNVTIGGNLRNSSFGNFSDGGVSVGTGGMTVSDLLTVNGTLDNTGGLLNLTGGQSGAAARIVVNGALQSTLTGNYSIAGNAGGASLQYATGGITQIGDGTSNAAVLTIDGANAFFEVGATNSNSGLNGLTTIAGNGLLDLRDAVSVTTTGALTVNGGDGRLKVDAYGGSGGGNVTIGGNLTNSSFGNFSDGGVSVGNSGMTASDRLTVNGTLANTSGLLNVTGGQTGAAARVVVTGAAQSTLTGNYSIAGNAGGASLQYGSGGITQIGDGASNAGVLLLDGANAFAEIGATNSNNALTGLTTIAGNGLLDLRDAVTVSTTGALTVNGGDGRLKVDAYAGSGGSNVTIGGNLSNASFGNFGDGGISVGNSGMTVSDLLTVNGTFTNAGGLLDVFGGQGGAAARMVVTGAVQNTLTGNYSVVGNAGGASLQYGGGGVTQIGDGAANGGYLYIDGANAFAEIGATNSNNALTGLTTIAGNGALDLRDAVTVSTTGALSVNSGGRLKIDAYGGIGGGNVTIGGDLTNASFGNFGDGGVAVGIASMTSSDLLTVTGALHNTGLLNIAGNSGAIGAEAVVTVAGGADNAGNVNIGTRGALVLTGGGVMTQSAGRTDISGTLTAAGVDVNAGLINVTGGTIAGGTLALSAGATLTGRGTVVSAISGPGTIQAIGGTLDLAGGLAASASVAIENGAVLDIAGPDSGAVNFAGASGILVLDQAIGFTGTITGLAVGDTLLLRGVQGTGATTTFNAGSNTTTLTVTLAGGGALSFTLAGNYSADGFGVTRVGADTQIGAVGAAVGVINTPTPIVLPKVRGSAAGSTPLSITNSAASGGAALDVSIGGVTGGAAASGTITALAPGATDTTSILVGLRPGVAGVQSGTITVDFASDLGGGNTAPLPDETVTITGTVYREAFAAITPLLLFAHVGDPGVENLNVANIAPADGFSESLIASLTGVTGGFALAGAGPTGDIAAGASDAATLRLNFSTAQSGTVSGTAQIALTSDGGTGGGSIDGLGTIALPAQAVPISISIDNFATATIAAPPNYGVLTQVGNAATLDLGTIAENTGLFDINFGVVNTGAGVADLLSGSFAATAANGFSLTGLGSFSGIAAGQTDAAGVTLDTAVGGTFSQTITLDPTGSNPGGFSAPLAEQTLTISGTVLPLPPPVITAAATLNAMTSVPVLVGLTVGDPNIDTLPLTVTISDTSGVLVAQQAGSATVSGNGSNRLVLTGDIPELNEELASLAYSGVAVGADTINIGIVDQHHASAQQQIAVGVSPVPHTGPVFNGPSSQLSVVGALTGYGGLSISDPYAEANNTTVTIGFVANSGTLQVTGNYGGTIIGQGTGTLSIIGTVPQINAYLGDGLLGDIGNSLGGIAFGMLQGFIRHGTIVAFTENDLVALAGGPEGKFFALGVESAAFALNSLIGLIPGNTPPSRADFIKTLTDIIGDVHIVASNGAIYDFNAEGEYVLAAATQPGDSFDVQVRLQSFNNSPYASVVTQVGAQVGTDRVTFDINRASPVWIDGTAAAIPTVGSIELNGGVLTQVSADSYRISWNTGEVLNVTDDGTFLNAAIAPGPNNDVGSLVGLATLADLPEDEFQLVDGSILQAPLSTATLYGPFASAWAVPQADSLFDYLPGQTTATFKNPGFPSGVITLADLPASVVAQAASVVAAAGIIDPNVAAAIEFDYIVSGGDASIVAADAAFLVDVATASVQATRTGPAPVAIGVLADKPEIEGQNNAVTSVVFDAYLTARSSVDETIDFAVVAGATGALDAAAFGGTLPSGQITIPAGQISGQFTIAVPSGALGLNPISSLAVRVSATDGTTLFAPTAQTTIVQAIPGPPAIPVIADITNFGSFSGSGTSYTLDLGEIQYGEPVPDIHLKILNGAAAPSDRLSGTIGVAPVEGFTVAGTTLPSPLGGGESWQNLTVTVNSIKFGPNDETITFNPVDSNITGFSQPLAPITITIKDTVVPPTMVFSYAWGDVHIVTYNGLIYDFQGAGEFTLAQSRIPGDTFDIQMRLVPYNASATVTLINQVAVSCGTDKVTFDGSRDDTVWINGAPSTVSELNPVANLNGGTLVRISDSVWQVKWDTGEEATITQFGHWFNISDGIPLSEPNLVGGLQGEDAGPTNDFQLPDGTVLQQPLTTQEVYGEYADSWRVPLGVSLFDYEPGQSPATFNIRNFPLHQVTLGDLPTSLVAQSAPLVRDIGDPGIAAAAQLDYLATGDPLLIQAAEDIAAKVTSTIPVPIQNSTPPPPVLGVKANPPGYVEAANAPTPIVFNAYLSNTMPADTVVSYTVVAAGAGFADATTFGGSLPSGTVTIAAGATLAPFTINLPANALGVLPTEQLEVQIGTPGTNPIFAPLAIATIANNTPEPGAPAVARMLKLSNGGTLIANGATSYTLNLGTLTQGQVSDQIQLALANVAPAPADTLTGTFTAPGGSGFLITGNRLTKPIDAGGQYSGIYVAPLTTSVGTHSESFTFNGRDINDSGFSSALAPITVTVVDTVLPVGVGQLNTPQTIVFPNVHVGTPDSQGLSVSNTGAAPISVSVSAVNPLITTGKIDQLAAGTTDSTTLGVSVDTTTAGPKNGAVHVDFGPADPIVDVFGNVFRLAAAGIAPVTAFVHVNDPSTVSIKVGNTAAADGFSENLLAALTGVTGPISVVSGGPTGEIAPGATDSDSLTLAFSSAVAGTINATATVDLTSDGGIGAAAIDGLGTTALGPQLVPVAIAVQNFAKPVFEDVSNIGSFSGGGTAYALDLGSIPQGVGAFVVNLGVLNNVASPADDLSGSLTAIGSSAFTNSGLAAFSGVAAGQANVAPTVTLATSAPGTFTETITLTPTGSNPSGFSAVLPAETLTITGTVTSSAGGGAAPAVATVLPAGTINFGAVHVGASVRQGLTIGNAAVAPADLLNASVAATTGNAVASGTIAGLAAGSTDTTSINAGIDTGTAGLRTGAVVLGFVSDAGAGGTASLPPQTIAVAGTSYREAAAALLPLTAIVHVGDPGTAALSISNSDPADGFSERLVALLVSTTGNLGIAANGPTPGIAAGDTNTTALALAFSTAQAGTVSGTATVGLTSDGGTGPGALDGLGVTALSGQTAPVSIVVDNYADPVIASSGNLTASGANAYTLDLGTAVQGSAPLSATLTAGNNATGPADWLNGSWTVSGGAAFANSGFGSFSVLNGGTSLTAGGVSLATGAAGVFSETITLSPTDANAAGYSAALPAKTITVTGRIAAPGTSGPPTAPPTGTAEGDVHMMTFDGLRYDFQAAGAFVLTQATAAGDPFQIQIETAADVTINAVSIATKVAAQVGADVVTFGINRSSVVWIDGAPDTILDAEHPVQGLNGGQLVRLSATDFRLSWTNGPTMTVSDGGPLLNMSVSLSDQYGPGSVRGLMGANSGQDKALQLSDGTVIARPSDDNELTGAFADSWRVTPATSLLDDTPMRFISTDAVTGQTVMRATAAGQILDATPGVAVLSDEDGFGVTFRGTLADLSKDIIAGFTSRDILDIVDLAGASATAGYSGSAESGVLQLGDGVRSGDIRLSGQISGGGVHVTSDTHGGSLIGFS